MRLFAWFLTAGAASVSACGDSVGGTDGSGDSTSETSTVDTTTSAPPTTSNPTTEAATDTTTSESTTTSSTSDTTPTTTTPTTTTGPVDCDVLDDCVDAASECRLALACDAGACVYEDAPAGTPVAAQTPGDCTVLACDGAGAIAPLPDPADVVVLEGTHTHRCALFADGTVRCWGFNAGGALGQGHTESRGDEPGEMGAALPAIDLL